MGIDEADLVIRDITEELEKCRLFTNFDSQMMEPEDKIKFRNDYAKVSTWINEFDPMGFISAGAPYNEYDSLTHQILSFLYEKKPRSEIKELILDKLENHFEWAEVRTQNEPYNTTFNNDLEKFLDKLEKEL